MQQNYPICTPHRLIPEDHLTALIGGYRIPAYRLAVTLRSEARPGRRRV